MGDGALACTRWTGDTNASGSTELRMKVSKDLVDSGTLILHDADGPRECSRISRMEAGKKHFSRSRQESVPVVSTFQTECAYRLRGDRVPQREARRAQRDVRALHLPGLDFFLRWCELRQGRCRCHLPPAR